MPRFAFLDKMHLSKESDIAHEIGNAFNSAWLFLKLAAKPEYAGNITPGKLAEREALIASFDKLYHAGFLPMRKRYRGVFGIFLRPRQVRSNINRLEQWIAQARKPVLSSPRMHNDIERTRGRVLTRLGDCSLALKNYQNHVLPGKWHR